jgi:hypothetical protein
MTDLLDSMVSDLGQGLRLSEDVLSLIHLANGLASEPGIALIGQFGLEFESESQRAPQADDWA